MASDLDTKEMMRRLWDAANDEVVKDAYEAGLKQVGSEEAAMARVDAKATGLFGIVGFCMTLAITFGGWSLLDNTRKVPLGGVIAGTFILVLLVGIVTAWHALKVLSVERDIKSINEAAVFDARILSMRQHRSYRIFLAAHVWEVATKNCQRTETKAERLWNGQRWFGGFLGGIVLLSILVVVSALMRKPDAEHAAVDVECHCGPILVVAPDAGYDDASPDVERPARAETSTSADAGKLSDTSTP